MSPPQCFVSTHQEIDIATSTWTSVTQKPDQTPSTIACRSSRPLRTTTVAATAIFPWRAVMLPFSAARAATKDGEYRLSPSAVKSLRSGLAGRRPGSQLRVAHGLVVARTLGGCECTLGAAQQQVRARVPIPRRDACAEGHA